MKTTQIANYDISRIASYQFEIIKLNYWIPNTENSYVILISHNSINSLNQSHALKSFPVKQSKMLRDETRSPQYTNGSITFVTVEIVGNSISAAHTPWFRDKINWNFSTDTHRSLTRQDRISGPLHPTRVGKRSVSMLRRCTRNQKFDPLTSTFPSPPTAPRPFSPTGFLLIAYGNYCLRAKYVDTPSWVVSKITLRSFS